MDVACGTGSTAIPAARAGGRVIGVDIALNLLEQARKRTASEGLNCQFDEGDAEALAYTDGSFDTVITMFGAMFAPRPEKVAEELVHVCRSGGRIVMANWTPTGFVGQMFKRTGSFVPPPPNMPSLILTTRLVLTMLFSSATQTDTRFAQSQNEKVKKLD
ncbi:MAG: class I SAM-dependent methyltransferase [Actinomycetota bacterium]